MFHLKSHDELNKLEAVKFSLARIIIYSIYTYSLRYKHLSRTT